MKAITECKQCGGEVAFEEGKQVAVCPYCGSQNTLSKLMEKQGGLVNRANYLRRHNEFDKAMIVYDDLLKIDNTDYEAHWGMVLCRYGIEYVVDPVTNEKVHTCHRTQSQSIFTDISYKAAIEFAPLDAQEVYEQEAKQIDDIQKNIIALSLKEEKYDVFICYKETDNAGNRTEDSVIAQELEFELKKRGYRVFFARKTLEGKLGSAYEPIIYAALHSAKVMVVLGTTPENFNAVWVKNEWQRYLELIRAGEDKELIPAYRKMSPYDLPQEFSNLQSLDMSKLGFMQDLCDGIDRMTREDQHAGTANKASGVAGPSSQALCRRAFLFIEENNTERANEYLERALDMNPENANAYIGKLMLEYGVRFEKDLKACTKPLEVSSYFAKAMRFADSATTLKLAEYNKITAERAKKIETERQTEVEKQYKILEAERMEKQIESIENDMSEYVANISGGGGAIFYGIVSLVTGFLMIIICIISFEVMTLFIAISILALGSLVLNTGITRFRRIENIKKISGVLTPGMHVSDVAKATALDEQTVKRDLEWFISQNVMRNLGFEGNTVVFDRADL